MQSNIHAQIRDEWRSLLDDKIEIVPGYSFSQYDTIKRVHLYLNSQFESSKKFMGRDKMFFNISKYRTAVATRMLNFDTKDLRLIPENFESSLKGFLLEKEFQLWMKTSMFAQTLNQIAEEVPQYGTIVLRKVPGSVEVVDLRRLACDQAVDRIRKSPYITLKRYMTASEIRKQKGWDPEVKKALLSTPPPFVQIPSYEDEKVFARGSGGRYYEIFERYGEVPRSWLKESSDKETLPTDGMEDTVRAFFVTANSQDYGTAQSDPQAIIENGKILFKGEWLQEWPFWDFHYFQTKGRWLGVGVVEDLFAVQERENEISNQKRIAMEISSLHLFQTSSQTVLQNLLSDARPGDVIQNTGDGEIKAIATENRDLASFSTEEQRYDQQADRISFAYDATRGEGLGSSTPATNAVIQQNASSGVYDFKKETIGINLRFFLLDWVLPELVKDLNRDHILRFTGSMSDLRRIDDVIVESMKRDFLMKRLLDGNIVTEEEADAIEEQLRAQLGKRGVERFLEIVKGFYDDVKVDFDFVVTNEQKDMQVLAGNIFNVLSSIGANPEMLKNPVLKSLLKKYAEVIGIPPLELDFAEAESNEMEQKTGVTPGAEGGAGMAEMQEMMKRVQSSGARQPQMMA